MNGSGRRISMENLWCSKEEGDGRVIVNDSGMIDR